MAHQITKTTEESKTPFEGIISRVKMYVKDPSLVDKKTLQDLLEELEDLRPIIDGEDEEGSEHNSSHDRPSLIIAIGKRK